MLVRLIQGFNQLIHMSGLICGCRTMSRKKCKNEPKIQTSCSKVNMYSYIIIYSQLNIPLHSLKEKSGEFIFCIIQVDIHDRNNIKKF